MTHQKRKRKMKLTYRVSLGFAKLNDDSLLVFGAKVHADLYSASSAALYPDPPATAAELLAAINAFSDAKVAQANGGKLATAEKNARREELDTLLKRLATYVQLACNNDLPTLLASGFDATSTNRAKEPLPKLEILRIAPGMSGQSLVTAVAQRNARSYEMRMAEVDEQGAPGPWAAPVTSTSSRRIALANQVPGRLYAVQGRSFGASGYSEWSDVVVQRAA